MTQVPNVVPEAARVLIWQWDRSVLGRGTGTISREAPLIYCQLAGVTTLISLQAPSFLSQAGLASLSTGRDKLLGCVRGSHHLAQEGTFELVAEGEVRQQGEGRMSPLHVREHVW
jgi:hypothetical protein